MIPLYSEFEFQNAKSKDMLPCKCYHCNKTFFLTKHRIKDALNPNEKTKGNYCSEKCGFLAKITKQELFCTNCNKLIKKCPKDIKKSKNHFCSSSCAATYNNLHKIKGNCRSKLEQYLEIQLKLLYPNLLILFNNKEIINSELDIYIPELKLAFELNGIFHYEPIYGQEKLNQILNNDNRKFQACIEKGIELCTIDTSQQNYFKIKTSQKYLSIVISIINNKV